MTALYFARAAAAGPGGGQAARQPDLPRHPVSARQPDARASCERFRGYGGRAVLSLAHQGHGRRRFLDRLGRPRRRADAVRRRWCRTMCARTAGAPSGRKAAWSRSSAMPSSTRATSSRRCSKAGSTACATCWWVDRLQPPEPRRGGARRACGSAIEHLFRNFGWDVVILKYGALQEAAFAEPGGEQLRDWIDACPNQLYSALVFQGGAALAQAAARRDRRSGPVISADRAALATTSWRG